MPRDVVAACAPQPKDIGAEMTGRMLVGVHCIGKKNGDKKEYFIYQPFDNQASMKRWHSQAVTAQTFQSSTFYRINRACYMERVGSIFSEYFDLMPYMN